MLNFAKNTNMKRVFITICVLWVLIATAFAQENVLRVLAIGNSFSEDAVEQYLWEIAHDDGREFIIGNAYRGGQSLKSHWKEVTEGPGSFEYRKIIGGRKTNSKGQLLQSIIEDEPWDIITFQQVSQDAGLSETYEPYLGQLIAYAKEHCPNPDVVFGLHQTWAYAWDSNHSGFNNYDRDQQKMYRAVVSAYNVAKSRHPELKFIIPTGTAIQNARTSFIGDRLCRDGFHLDRNIGRLTAAYTWYYQLTERPGARLQKLPVNISPTQDDIASKAAIRAFAMPDRVTPLEKPLRLAVAGVTHGHLWEVIRRIPWGEFEVVGVWEKDDNYFRHNGLRGKVNDNCFYQDLGRMLEETHPEAVVAYGSIYDHLQVVEACAPRGIHVMVEKPLATTVKQALRIEELARNAGIMVLTNYETSWYGSNHEVKAIVDSGQLGAIRRINVYDGHQGPFEIGCGKEFTDWLTDPVLNGGGAVIDFGCYGANLATWLLKNERPISVQAVLQQNKPHKYPKVDDDATILVRYPHTTVQIMGSWCWPMNRKDMYVYGDQGYVYQKNATELEVLLDGRKEELSTGVLPSPVDDSFRYLRAAVRGHITVLPTDLASIENNRLVVEILNAAIQSSKTGKAVKL